METTKKTNDKAVNNAYEKILEFLEVDEILAVLATEVGMCEMMAKHLFAECDFNSLPTHIKYAILQHANAYVFLGKIVSGEIQRSFKKIEHLPVTENWCNAQDAEERLIYVVKGLYELLKKQGKIP